MELNSWAGLSASVEKPFAPRDRYAAQAGMRFMGGAIYGAGRSYSDVALPRSGEPATLTAGLDHVMSFDRQAGLMEVEAGLSLRDAQELALSAGWGLAVIPGTAWATVGGAIANDVHGKNHAMRGAFSRSVASIRLLRADRGLFLLDRDEPDMWRATVGGLGATGAIVSATLKLIPWASGWIQVRQTRFEGLAQWMELTRETPEYAVAWVDTFASPVRGVLFTGAICAADPYEDGVSRREPGWAGVSMPRVGAINAAVSKGFNKAYWLAHPNGAGSRTRWAEFFCPLDGLRDWNRLYGVSGFSQFQCVVPERNAIEAYEEMFRRCRKAGQGSFLSVIKRFGPTPSEGALSFAREGVTFAMDFPNRAQAPELLASLAALALEAGGALYPAKMNFASMAELTTSFPEWEAWRVLWDYQTGACATKWLDRLGLAKGKA